MLVCWQLGTVPSQEEVAPPRANTDARDCPKQSILDISVGLLPLRLCVSLSQSSVGTLPLPYAFCTSLCDGYTIGCVARALDGKRVGIELHASVVC